MTYHISILYDEKTKQDALDTFQDVQSELDAWKVPYQATNGKIKKVSTEEVQTAFVPYEEDYFKTIEQSDILYTTDRVKRKLKKDLPHSTVKILCHDRPFQDLIPMVLEMKTRYEEEICKKESIKEEQIDLFSLDVIKEEEYVQQ